MVVGEFTPDQVAAWLGIIAAIGTAVLAFLKSPNDRKKTSAEASAIAVKAQAQIIDDLQSVVIELRSDNQTLNQENRDLAKENRDLQAKVYALEIRKS